MPYCPLITKFHYRLVPKALAESFLVTGPARHRHSACMPGLGKTTITVRHVATAAAAFYFPKSRYEQGLAGLTPYSAAVVYRYLA